ncbi:MAG: hypothetical protein CL677_08950 [Bdellovibrionaceae bacterium]|mgnify:FL=1|nr:hypothetical protein [Pseudobdellovibrionaceae bacterium]
MLILFVSLSAVAEEDGNQIVIQPGEGVIPKSQLHKGKPFYGFFPYMPRQREYAIELGSMWEEQTMYWAGVKAGWHVGNCVFTETQTCQQYWDLVGGVGGRDGYTLGLILTGPRWQFVSYPSIYSPSLSLFVGALNISDEDRDEQKFAYGIGYGWTMAVHQNLDIRLEGRVGGGDILWTQAFISIGLKIDNLVQYFADKIKSVGKGTVDVTEGVIKGTGKVIKGTGEAIKGTGEALGDVIIPKKKEKREENQ